jgi:methionine synthase II (cobalamin-independent)
VKLPEGKIVNPGVIESKSNFIEHPELIANRISNYAKLVGRENLIASSDCGYGTWSDKPRSILTSSGRNWRHSPKALVLPPTRFFCERPYLHCLWRGSNMAVNF